MKRRPAKRSANSLIQWLDRFPPCIVRILARKNAGRRGMTNQEIAARSGLTSAAVGKIANRTTWYGLKVDTIDRFCLGCGFNHTRTNRHADFLRRRDISYLTQGKPQHLAVYKRLLRLAAMVTPKP